MLQRLWKKRLAAVAFVAALAVTGAAVAYFTGGSGSGTGSGTVGSSSALTVAVTGTPTWSGSLTALYPESAGVTTDTELIPFTVTNNGNGHQTVTTVTAAVSADTSGNAKTAAGASITGCLASWFTVTVENTPALPSNLGPAGTYAGKVDLTMQDSGTNQNPCQGVSPGVTVTAS